MEWITCENTYEESWRRLLEFANVELAMEAIAKLHGAPKTSSMQSNYKKQAEQIRVALLQAKEYFEAAKTSSLYTQPNHLYYGSVALSTACMLIRGDGRYSLDCLRKESKNASHGLDFTFSSDIKRSKLNMSLLEDSYVKVCPNGHFVNWYKTLQSYQNIYAVQHRKYFNGASSRNMELAGQYIIPIFDELCGQKVDLMFLLKRLPDLYSDLGRFGVKVNSVRGELRVYVNEDKGRSYDYFTIHSAPTNEAFLNVIEQFKCDEGVMFEYDFDTDGTTGTITSRKDKDWQFSFPDQRTTLDHKTIFYGDQLGTPEVVDLFLISYSLSMLSRYFPDIWVSFLESHCKGAKLVERLVRILYLKMPNLMLNQMIGDELIISNHRPLWH